MASVLAAAQIPSALCLPAGLRRTDAEAVVESFSRMRPIQVILTKWDETVAPGEALSVAIEKELPISHITVGQEVPEDIVTADPGVLAASALSLSEELAEMVL
jgi:flagellar biosynthesis protein FlhF